MRELVWMTTFALVACTEARPIDRPDDEPPPALEPLVRIAEDRPLRPWLFLDDEHLLVAERQTLHYDDVFVIDLPTRTLTPQVPPNGSPWRSLTLEGYGAGAVEHPLYVRTRAPDGGAADFLWRADDGSFAPVHESACPTDTPRVFDDDADRWLVSEVREDRCEGSRTLIVTDLETGATERITDGSADARGGQFVLGTFFFLNGAALERYDLTSKTTEVVVDAIPAADTTGFDDTAPGDFAVSRHGHVAFLVGSTLTVRDPTSVLDVVVSEDAHAVITWSGDGRALTYLTEISRGEYQLQVFDRFERTRRALAPNTYAVTFPTNAERTRFSFTGDRGTYLATFDDDPVRISDCEARSAAMLADGVIVWCRDTAVVTDGAGAPRLAMATGDAPAVVSPNERWAIVRQDTVGLHVLDLHDLTTEVIVVPGELRNVVATTDRRFAVTTGQTIEVHVWPE